METELPNVFIRLYRHRPQRHRTPKENFVTEALALVFSMQRRILNGFFRLLGEEDIPDDVRVETQVPVDGSCFDITVSNNKDFYFLVECKLYAGFGGASDEQSDQLCRYAEEIRRSSARCKGLISLTVRTPPARDFGDARFLTARWADILELCAAQPASGQDIATALTRQFVDLLRFLKVDRGVHSNGRLLWRCDLCGLETSGQGIHSHREKHCREYAHLIEQENQHLRKQFEVRLAPYSQSIAAVIQGVQSLNKIEMSNYADHHKVIALLENAKLPRSLWLHVTSRLHSKFSNRAHASFSSELAQLPGVEMLAEPKYVSNTFENILAAIARCKEEQLRA